MTVVLLVFSKNMTPNYPPMRFTARLFSGDYKDGAKGQGRGRPAQLEQATLAQVRSALLQSPTVHGFGTELWTIKRVGALIERMHGVRFSQAHAWRILGALGFSGRRNRTSEPLSAMKCSAPHNQDRPDGSLSCIRFHTAVNRPGFRGGCLVKVKPGFRSSGRVADSSLPQPRPEEYTQSTPAVGSC